LSFGFNGPSARRRHWVHAVEHHHRRILFQGHSSGNQDIDNPEFIEAAQEPDVIADRQIVFVSGGYHCPGRCLEPRMTPSDSRRERMAAHKASFHIGLPPPAPDREAERTGSLGRELEPARTGRAASRTTAPCRRCAL
jgi:hypothetical protein